MNKIYAGIGSRNTPFHILLAMSDLSEFLDSENFTLRSGAAIGADKAFSEMTSKKEIFIPWNGYNREFNTNLIPKKIHYNLAKDFHPNWNRLTDGVKSLMARNTMVILGSDLKSPVDFVLCWTIDGCETDEERTNKTGGTGHAISIAYCNNIPIFNLQKEDCINRFHCFYNRVY